MRLLPPQPAQRLRAGRRQPAADRAGSAPAVRHRAPATHPAGGAGSGDAGYGRGRGVPSSLSVLAALVLAGRRRGRRARGPARPGRRLARRRPDRQPSAAAARPSRRRRPCWPRPTIAAPRPPPPESGPRSTRWSRPAALGPRVNVSVVDAATGEALFAQNADDLTTPASTTKLVTAVDRAGGARAGLPAGHPGGGRRAARRGRADRRRRSDAGGGREGPVPRRGPARQARRAGQEGARRHRADQGHRSTPRCSPGPVTGPGWDARHHRRRAGGAGSRR